MMENARKIIFKILHVYFSKKSNLNDIIIRFLNKKNVKSADKNLILNISKGVVRYVLTLDFLINKISGLDIKNIDFPALISLRMALYQILFLNRIPEYSAVNESVAVTKIYSGQKAANFVNAVLRKATRNIDLKEYLNNEIIDIKNRRKRISIEYSFPEWLVAYWEDYDDEIRLKKIFSSLNENPGFFFKVNTLKTRIDDFYKEMIKEFDQVKERYFGKTAFKMGKGLDEYINSKYIRNGLCFMQNLTSQMAIRYFLSPEPGEKILDLCSAPGGKAISSAINMNNKGLIVAVDNNKERLQIQVENLRRLSIRNVTSVNADVTIKDFLSNGNVKDDLKKRLNIEDCYDFFDKIFIDAPCSAFGTISKNPDAKYNKNVNQLMRFSKNSLKILSNADIYLKPGGKIIFYTCTLSKIENESVIKDFLEEFKDSYISDTLDIVDSIISENDSDFTDIKEMQVVNDVIEVMPYYFNSEGASICSLRKKSETRLF